MTELLFGDRVVRFLYCQAREKAPVVFRALTGRRVSSVLGFLNFDLPFTASLLGNRRFLESCGVNLSECLEEPRAFNTPRKVFERKIRYWDCRPMPEEPDVIVSPADARVVVGSLEERSALFLKGKFFELEELLGYERPHWHAAFQGGAFAIFRLTPDKYHYNHTPVAGQVLDVYELPGTYHSCNPSAVVELVTPYSKNRRTVTIIDTDVPGGSGAGLVAMIEVVALMIGEVVQCYSSERYEDRGPLVPGMFVEKGRPKSLYRPGSSTDVLLFEAERLCFAEDILRNQCCGTANSRFSVGFGQPLVETDVQVRSAIAVAKGRKGGRA